MIKKDKVKIIRDTLNIPDGIRIWQFILEKYPISIEIDERVLGIINSQVQRWEKIEITKKLLKHIIIINDFYYKKDEDFISKILKNET